MEKIKKNDDLKSVSGGVNWGDYTEATHFYFPYNEKSQNYDETVATAVKALKSKYGEANTVFVDFLGQGDKPGYLNFIVERKKTQNNGEQVYDNNVRGYIFEYLRDDEQFSMKII